MFLFFSVENLFYEIYEFFCISFYYYKGVYRIIPLGDLFFIKNHVFRVHINDSSDETL